MEKVYESEDQTTPNKHKYNNNSNNNKYKIKINNYIKVDRKIKIN